MDDDADKQKDGDAYHFIAYVPHGESIYELDGLRAGPIRVSPQNVEDNQDWLGTVRREIQRRVSEFDASVMTFNVMTVIRSRRKAAQECLSESSTESEREAARRVIAEEEAKMEAYRKANVRRRHNYLPFLIVLLKAMARKGVWARKLKILRFQL